MRTTLDLNDELIMEAKRRALEENTSLTRLLEAALRRYLQPQALPEEKFQLRLLTRETRLIPGVDLTDRDSLYERMEGR